MNVESLNNLTNLSVSMSLISTVFYLPITIAVYVVQGLALMRIAKKLDVPNGWMAFIPFAGIYLIGKLAEKSDERAYPGVEGKKWSKILLGWTIATIAVALVLTVLLSVGLAVAGVSMASEDSVIYMTVVACVVYTLLLLIPAVILNVYEYMAFYRIYRVMAGQKNAVWMLLLSIFVNPAATVLLAVLGFSPKYPVAAEQVFVQPEQGV